MVCLALLALSPGGSRPASAEPHQGVVRLLGWDGRGQPFELKQLRGQVVALTFASRYTREEASRINAALATRGYLGVRIVSVIDFAGIPALFYSYAKRKAAENDRSGRIFHLVDERGGFRALFQVDPVRRVDILIIDQDGVLRGRFHGERQLPEALRMIDGLRPVNAKL